MRIITVVFVMALLGVFSGMGCSFQDTEKMVPEKDLFVAENESSNYVIVAPGTPSEIDKFALAELSRFLKQSTGMEYKIEMPDKTTEKQNKIFVGLSSPALKVLGDSPLKGMKNQEHVARSIGNDIFLYGKGPHGNLYAVYDFLETSVGCRWYSVFGGMKIPEHKVLRLQPFNRKGVPSFQIRWLYNEVFYLNVEDKLFIYRNRGNIGLERHLKKQYSGILDEIKIIIPSCHTMFAYIPPTEKAKSGITPPLDFLKNKNYFKSNPEFFSMNKDGARTDALQLCLSNKELRKMLTENIMEHIRINDEKGVATFDANDFAGHFCYCQECAKLEAKYSCIGGPLFDYLIELCEVLKDKYPEVYVKALVYRKEQSQKPPKVDKLPYNMIPFFAPIDDNFAADWNHPSNGGTWQDLKDWCRLSQNVWVWYYPNPYVGSQPFGNIERLINDIRLMKQTGVKGIFFEHDIGVTEGLGFTELQSYLMLKLTQDSEQDADALIAEFMELQYGNAAKLMREYLSELEKCRKELKVSFPWNPSPNLFTYFNPDNMIRWEQNFDKMEVLVKDNPQTLFNVQQVRVVLDKTVLQNWQEVKKKYPDYFKDAKCLEARIHNTYDRMIKEHVAQIPCFVSAGNNRKKMFYDDLDAIMLLADKPGRPLPKIFDGIKDENIRRIVPTTTPKNQRIEDTEAAFGFAEESIAEKPFQFGFYDNSNQKHGISQKIQTVDIKPGAYYLYKLGDLELTPNCVIWLANSSWAVSSGNLARFYEPGELNKWIAYVSIKFEGPSYQKDSKLKEDRVLCDQIVLVKANE